MLRVSVSNCNVQIHNSMVLRSAPAPAALSHPEPFSPATESKIPASSSAMARQVLAFGALAVLLLLFAWIMHLVLLSQFAPMMHPPVSRTGFVIRCLKNGEGSPFSGFAPAVWFWVALLCVGVAADFYA